MPRLRFFDSVKNLHSIKQLKEQVHSSRTITMPGIYRCVTESETRPCVNNA